MSQLLDATCDLCKKDSWVENSNTWWNFKILKMRPVTHACKCYRCKECWAFCDFRKPCERCFLTQEEYFWRLVDIKFGRPEKKLTNSF